MPIIDALRLLVYRTYLGVTVGHKPMWGIQCRNFGLCGTEAKKLPRHMIGPRIGE